MDIHMRGRCVYRFGPYLLDPTRRVLRRNGAAVALPARLFDTLLCLVEAQEHEVGRDALQRALWPGRTMDDNNVGQAISALRRALQDGAGAEPVIVTVRQGYRLALPVSLEPNLMEVPAAPPMVAGTMATALDPPAPGPQITGQRFPGRRALSGGKPGWRLLGRKAGLAAIVLLAAACAFALLRRPSVPAATGSAPPAHSVAVLAFDNLSGDPGQDYFAEGLSEELIDSLGSIAGVRVAARQSAFSFRTRPVTVADIARQLNVSAVLEGSVRQDGGRLRITARLIDATTGFEVWSQSFDRDRGAALAVQSEIAGAVARGLRVTLGQGEGGKDEGGTSNPEALDRYLRGMKLVHDGDATTMQAAIAAFDAAIALDPAFARAHMQRAAARQTVSQTQGGMSVQDVRALLDQAVFDARQAVALAPELGLAHAVLGGLLMEARLDFPHAAQELARARTSSPGDARVLTLYAMVRFRLGHVADALSAAADSALLDPLSPDAYRELAGMLSDAGRPADAATTLRHAEELVGAKSGEDDDLEADIALARQDFGAARRLCAGGRDWQQVECLAIADRRLGRIADADADTTRLHALLGDTGALQYAEIAAQSDHVPQAAMWLRAAYRLRDPGLATLKADPLLQPLRGTPDFIAIEQAVLGTLP